ncbi:MAG: hypothetical protein NTY41_15615 [Proteobacteria bacterium]|nr:hypothetical protein [Pseudomonadota bacterium]
MERIRRQVGLNKFEFSIVLVVLGPVWLLALDRFNELQEIAEKTAVEVTIVNIRSGLRWEMSERIMTGREASIVELVGSNPVRWLEKPPEGYLGEFSAAPPRFPSGSWYFDGLRKVLFYRPILRRNLACQACQRVDGDIAMGWRIAPTGKPPPGRVGSVQVVTDTPYRWF